MTETSGSYASPVASVDEPGGMEREILDPRRAQRSILYAAAAAAALALLVMLGVMFEIVNARDDVGELARTADRSTFLIGDIGRQSARMQLALFRALEDEREEVGRRLARVERASDRIDADLRELEPLLSRAERRVWPSFIERLERAREELEVAGAALRANDEARAALHLSDATALTTALQEQVDSLAHLNQSESEHHLDKARDRLGWSLWILGALGGLLLVGGSAIWAYAFRAERARRHLEQSLLSLARNNRELDIFAGRAAHDIRNLLAPVSLAARSLDAVSADPARVRYVARQLRRSSERAVEVLDGLLAFARASEQKTLGGAFVPGEVDASLEDLRPRLAGKDVVVDAHVDDGHVGCDARLLRIVVSNLLDNAMKFSTADGPGHVRVIGRLEDEHYSLEVHDNGPGIPEHALARLFEPFYRVDGSRAPGTGLGLATVHRIVDAHDGALEVESQLGEGTLFRVRLPCAAGSSSQSRREERSAAPPSRGQ